MGLELCDEVGAAFRMFSKSKIALSTLLLGTMVAAFLFAFTKPHEYETSQTSTFLLGGEGNHQAMGQKGGETPKASVTRSGEEGAAKRGAEPEQQAVKTQQVVRREGLVLCVEDTYCGNDGVGEPQRTIIKPTLTLCSTPEECTLAGNDELRLISRPEAVICDDLNDCALDGIGEEVRIVNYEEECLFAPCGNAGYQNETIVISRPELDLF